jgi:two-component system NtrC family sensor kinase
MMNKLIYIVVLFLLYVQPGHAQNDWSNVDSLKKLLKSDVDNSERFETMNEISFFYLETNLDSSMAYAEQAYQLSLQSSSAKIQADGLERMGTILWRRGNTATSIELLLESLHIAEGLKDSLRLSTLYFDLGNAYHSQSDEAAALSYYSKSLRIRPALATTGSKGRIFMTIGSIYLKNNQADSALFYARQCYSILKSDAINSSNKRYLPASLNLLGDIKAKLHDTVSALQSYRQGIKQGFQYFNLKAVTDNYLSIAKIFKRQNFMDSGYYYASQAYNTAKQVNSPYSIEETSSLLKDIFKETKKLDSAFKYHEIMVLAKDSILNIEKIRQMQNLSFAEHQRQQEIGSAKVEFQRTIKLYVLIAALFIFLITSFILYRNNRQKQKANLLLEQQKQTVEHTLKELKSTQAQLIQSEKMASLGELTAGIAHEIENPLNFVNNFSEVNNELIAEMVDEVDKGNMEEVKAIANDIRQNLEKINHHGKRADAIVKGMLQHSRSSSGVKEPTDINALADEYLRLSYHGLRAKDKTFNATLQTDFDSSTGKINIVAQDIGRVLLNLYNNAFYAITEKKKQQGEGYVPTVSVSAKKMNSKVYIRVKDNGNGIPQKVLDKIFQPFFTTKPTGQGTGLGLSLSYDIIKTHGGEIKVETKEAEGSEFIIQIPVTKTLEV